MAGLSPAQALPRLPALLSLLSSMDGGQQPMGGMWLKGLPAAGWAWSSGGQGWVTSCAEE